MNIVAIVSLIVAAVVWIVYIIKDDVDKRKQNNGVFGYKETEKRISIRL